MAEVSAASIAGSRRALSRSRLRRLTALSRRSPRPVWLPWLRRSALGTCPGFAVAQHGVEDGQQLAHGGDESETGRVAGIAQTAVEGLERRVVLDGDQTSHVERRPGLDTAALDLAASSTTRQGDGGFNRATNAPRPSGSVAPPNAVPSGLTCTSTRAFDTSMPTKRSAMVSTSITQPPRCGLVPRRLFGFRLCRPAPHAPSRPRRPGYIRATGRARSASLAQQTKQCRDRSANMLTKYY